MCSKCDKKFHNKGKRAKHKREKVDIVEERLIFQNFILLFSDIYQIISEDYVAQLLIKIKEDFKLKDDKSVLHFIKKKTKDKEESFISTKIKQIFEDFNTHQDFNEKSEKKIFEFLSNLFKNKKEYVEKVFIIS
jgi:hypothetical protein